MLCVDYTQKFTRGSMKSPKVIVTITLHKDAGIKIHLYHDLTIVFSTANNQLHACKGSKFITS